MTLAVVATTVLLNERADERITAADKLRRFALAQAVHNAGEVDVSIEDIALLRSIIGESCAPLLVGRAYELLPH
jgi:hypothetical protein